MFSSGIYTVRLKGPMNCCKDKVVLRPNVDRLIDKFDILKQKAVKEQKLLTYDQLIDTCINA